MEHVWREEGGYKDVKTPIEEYFGTIFVLYLPRRTDRTEHVKGVLARLGIPEGNVFWFPGVDRPLDHEGRPNGNLGCTSGHRAILDTIIEQELPRALIFEDDVDVAFTDPQQAQIAHNNPNRGLRVNPQIWFQEMLPFIPSKWDMLYLGGHYGETPVARVNGRIIKIGRMLTTSSYGITLDFAKRLAPNIQGIGPIDTLYGGFHRANDCFCTDPRLFIQYTNQSDLADKVMNNSHCMMDQNHVKAMDAGKTYG